MSTCSFFIRPSLVEIRFANIAFNFMHFKNLLSCRSAGEQVHDPASRLGRAFCGSSICALRDVVHGNTRVVHRSDTDISSDAASSLSLSQNETAQLARSARHRPAPPVASLNCGRGGYYSPLPKLSGCYECHAVSVDSSSRYPRPRETLCACSDCGEVFTKPETLELHQITRHGVSELGPEDSGRNIVEIIFKSSWLKSDRPICKIERILKVHNPPRTVARFEDYRAAVKSRALPHSATGGGGACHNHRSRCAADGNELLRFHCTSLSCPLGASGSTSLCSNTGGTSSPIVACGVCAIIRQGFVRANHPHGVRTTASSGRAHDCGPMTDATEDRLRAMLVCRVIAGRVRRPGEDPATEDAYDSVAVAEAEADGACGAYGNLEELLVANPRAILPCFVVIYRALD
ncbi:hypothetical protein ZIOFF_028113 [Zingiber officinale]|uniref:C2H2-type domain-containing protein n=1 Tax=Zingiber officinale TaxID=94328 RepID=A0A8J5H5H2_ZINOF|nr:hypothetical protein ZIOFF_028113 [Zingiber officinale]